MNVTNTIREKNDLMSFPSLCRKTCVILVWITVLYSLVIQYMFFAVSNGMMFLGLAVLAAFLLAQTGEGFSLKDVFTQESAWMFAFLLFMLPSGLITAPSSTSNHMTQWITCMEYMFLLIVVSSLVKQSGKDLFHLMLLVVAVMLLAFFIKSPVSYKGTGRYSVSQDVNPNSLGMNFAEGIWAVLYFQQKKKVPVIISIAAMSAFCYGIILTGSRKSLIGAGIIILVWFAFCYLPNVASGNSPWKYFILVSAVLASVILAFMFIRIYAGSDMSSRMGELESETKAGSRSDMYALGWQLFQEHPLFGQGFQGFRYYYGDYSHATLVEVPVSAGVYGSVIYYASYFLSIRRIWKLYRFCRKKKEWRVELAQLKMMMAMWGAMLFYCTCVIHPYQFDSYIVFGVIFGQSAYIERKIREAKPQQAEQPVPAQKCKWIR